MAPTTRVKIRGAKELEKRLRELGPDIAINLGDAGLAAGAKVLVKEAKDLVPVRSGALQESITTVKRTGAGANRRNRVIGFHKPASRYAHIIEFGSRYQSAQPFMRPTIDSKQTEYLAAIIKTMSAGIAKITPKGGIKLYRELIPLTSDAIAANRIRFRAIKKKHGHILGKSRSKRRR
jgi:HK97 gp10 family phage protein